MFDDVLGFSILMLKKVFQVSGGAFIVNFLFAAPFLEFFPVYL